jgi:hypothetical protein
VPAAPALAAAAAALGAAAATPGCTASARQSADSRSQPLMSTSSSSGECASSLRQDDRHEGAHAGARLELPTVLHTPDLHA